MDWISVKDRSPENPNEQFLAYRKHGEFLVLIYDSDSDEWLHPSNCQPYPRITHWMPLPKPPKGG